MKEPSFISVSITILFLILLSGCSSTDDEILNDEVIEDLLINDTIHEDIEDLISETEDVPTEQVKETLTFSWNKDSDSRINDGSVPFIHKLKDGRTRLYYCNGENILSAVSTDGISFVKEQGVRITKGTGFELSVCDPTIIDLPNGEMRMYYKGANKLGGPGLGSIHKIYSAISTDGLTFKKEGIRIDSETNGDNGWASVPDAIVLQDGRIRIYYVTAAEMEHSIGSAISSDGLNFVKEPGIRVRNLVDPALVRIDDRYLLFAASINDGFKSLPRGVYYLESSDGLNFDEPVEVFKGDNVYDPSVLKIDDKTIRVFYGKINPPQMGIESYTGKIVE